MMPPFSPMLVLRCLCLALFLPLSANADAVGDHWVLRNQLPTGENLNASASNGNNNAVVVGNHGTILHTTTGTTWTTVATSVQTDITDVVFNGNIYVAVGAGGAILWSYDGNHWTVVTPVNASFTAITWTGTQFVAVGGTFNATTGWSGTIYTSPDGAVWTHRNVTNASSFFGVAHDASIITAICSDCVYTSSNGVVWTKRALPKNPATNTSVVLSVAWASNQFILTGEVVWTSPNGITWTIRNELPYAYVIGMKLRWTGNEMVATHEAGYFYTAADGVNWGDRSSGLLTPPLAAGRFAGGLLALGYGGHIERQVTPGVWSATHNSPYPASVLGLASSGSLHVAVANSLSWTSTDGNTWTEHYLPNTDMADVTWDGTQFIAVGFGAWRSTDGIAWTNTIPAPGSVNQRFFAVENVAGKTLASGYNGDSGQVISAMTTDGTNWVGANMNNVTLGLATDGSKIVGVGWKLGVITSTDGTNWTFVSGGNVTGEDFTSVVYADGQFVAVTSSGRIFTSATGTVWIARQTAPNFLRSIKRTTNEFIAVGNRGLIIRSFDGIFWQYSENPTTNDLGQLLWTGTRLIAGGASGNFFTSDGIPAVQPTVSLTGNSITLAESGGTATVTLTLSGPRDNPVNVPLSFTGSSGVNVDYTASHTSVTFQPGGALTQTVTLTAKTDVLDEPDETLTVTALQPSGDAALSATIDHTLTITDDDSEPVFGDPLVDQLVAVGMPFSFNSPATGTVPMSYQWKKGTAAVPGARAATYAVAKAALSHAGEYSVDAKNISGTKTSSKAKLGVVTVSDQVKVVKAGTAINFTANAAGAVSYRWRHSVTGPLFDGPRISGAATPKLILIDLVPGDSAVYVCDVMLGALTLTSTTVNLGVIDAIPAIAPQEDVHTRVADPFDFTPAVSNRPHKWAYSNLPTGLSASTTTGRISGKPVKDGSWAVKLIATNLYGPSLQATINIIVGALPEPAIGTFVALLPRDPLNNNLGGRVEVTTQSNGTYSGKVALSAASYGFKSTLSAPPASDPGALITVSRGTKLPALNLIFSIDSVTGQFNAQVGIGLNSHSGTGLPRAAAPTARTGAYNVALSPEGGSPPGAPQGHGYVQFTVAASGSFSAAGRLADDSSYTVASQVSANGTVPLFIPLYADKGSALGNLTLTEDAGSGFANNFITGAFTWVKAATHAGRSYAGGFSLMTLNADGGRYVVPVVNQVVMNLAGPVQVAFTGANLDLASRVPDNIFNVSTIANVSQAAAIPAGTTLAFDPKKGLFSGKFFLNDMDTSILPNKALPRTVLYSGVLIRPGGLPEMKGLGYFNLAQMPTASPKITGTTSPTLSGAVSVTP